MTLKGKTGLALFTAGVSSFIGGTVAIIVLPGWRRRWARWRSCSGRPTTAR